MTVEIWVCWSIISEAQMVYGVAFCRHGSARALASNHANRARRMAAWTKRGSFCGATERFRPPPRTMVEEFAITPATER